MAGVSAWAADAYKTKNVIVVVMDGVRYMETFGDPARSLIPRLAALEKEGTLFTNFRIAGPGVSVTRQGHSTISTGTWQTVALGGARMTMPTFFEYARNELGWKESDCWAVFGKGMYSYARYSSFPTYGERYKPSFVIGIGEGKIENDDQVLDRIFQAMDKDKPKLIFANFGVTDHLAHVAPFEDYQNAIRHCDEMFGKLWDKVQSTPGYKDATTVFFTNDHGRHTDRPQMDHNGFQSHGDQCDGCRHIMLLAVGPDVKKGAVVDREVQQIDLCPTVGELLGFQTPLSDGSVVTDFLVNPLGLNTKTAKTPEAKEGVRLAELSKRDLVKTIADANLKRDITSVKPSVGAEMLMRGMLQAAGVTKDARYREYVQSWLAKNESAIATDPSVARVALELAAQDACSKADLDKAIQLAHKLAQTGSPANADAVALVARAAAMGNDQKLKDALKPMLGLVGKTEQQMLTEWRARKLNPPPMACDVPAEVKNTATMDDALRLAAISDACAASPDDRIVRLACNIQEMACAQGRPELGSNWTDPVQSALTLASLYEAADLKPKIQWVKPRPKPANGKKKPAPPRWTNPLQADYKDSVHWQTMLLRYQVDENGHFAKGDAMSDGAALMLFCTARVKPLGGARLRTQVKS